MTKPDVEGLIEELRRIARFRLQNPDLAIEWRAADALTQTLKDRETLREVVYREGYSDARADNDQPDENQAWERSDARAALIKTSDMKDGDA